MNEKIKEMLIAKYGEEWWKQTEAWLKENFGYPKVYDIPKLMAVDYHPIFRPLLKSIFPLKSESSGVKKLVAHSRSKALLNMRIFPHYFGILDPAYSSRARDNFGLVCMLIDKEHGRGIWSRATLNCPFFNRQKLKRLVLASYGVSKNGKNFTDWKKYPKGGVFLLNPDVDEKFDSLTPYRDYSYVALNVRFPKNYREFIKVLDGSVLISKSAAKKLKYAKIARVIVRNPHPNITKKIAFIIKTKEPKEGAKIEFQEPLSITSSTGDEVVVATSPVSGYVKEAKLLTPQVKQDERKVWELLLWDEREAELGCKLESATGLKNTIAGYTDDKEPTIVIHPDMLKDRAMYWEIKETGKLHVFPTITGKDGNISNKNIRISRTLIQGILAYPPKVQAKIVKQLFNKDNLSFAYPTKIITIIEHLDKINPEKLLKKYPVFFSHFYYIRRKKVGDRIYVSEEPTKTFRALQKLYQVKDYDKLSSFYQKQIDEFVKLMTSKLLLGDRDKKCQIKLKGYLRITLWKESAEINTIEVSPELYEKLGKPKYVIWFKEPVSRQQSIRCLEVVVNKKLEEQVVAVHPYLGMDYDNEEEEFNTKLDSVMPYTPILVKVNDEIKLVTFEQLFEMYSQNKYIRPDGKEEIVLKNVKVLGKNGWQKAFRIIRHKTDKEIYSINFAHGRVDVTEDHSLIINNSPTSPKELTAYNSFVENIKINLPEEKDIPIDLAWLYGFFVAEGHAKKYLRKNSKKKGDTRYEFHISNKDINLLERAKKILEKYWSEYSFKIVHYKSDSTYKLIVNGKKWGHKRDFIMWWNKNFYSGNDKTIPDFLLKAKLPALGAFLVGYLQGNGHIYINQHGKMCFSTNSHTVAWFITYILQRIGYEFSVQSRKDKIKSIHIFTVPLKGESSRYIKNRNTITKIMRFKYSGYVYDIETETHEFYAGIGNVRLHNTDGDLSAIIPIKECIPELQYKKKKKVFSKSYRKWKKVKNIDDLPEPEYNYSDEQLVLELYDYQRYRSVEAYLITQFGGLKNLAMYTDIAKDWKAWNELLRQFDIELKLMQAEKRNPELKGAPYSVLADHTLSFLQEVYEFRRNMPEPHPLYRQYINLPDTISYKNRHMLKQVLKQLKRSRHPVFEMYYIIYKEVGIL